MELPLNSTAAPDNACAPTKVLGTTPGPSCTVMPWAVMLAPTFRASSPGTAAWDTVMLEPAVTVQEVPSTKTGPAAQVCAAAPRASRENGSPAKSIVIATWRPTDIDNHR
ncbi:hypothetical protein ACOJBM_16690 [Rhizobium beringeri]